MKALCHFLIGLILLALAFAGCYAIGKSEGSWYLYIGPALFVFAAYHYWDLIEED